MEISSLGVGSGLDLGSLVTQLVAAERSPGESRLNRVQARAQAQLSAFGSVKSATEKLQGVLDELALYQGAMSARSNLPEQVAAVAGSGAESGRYRIAVTQLATAQSLASDVFADADAALGEGTLQIAVGDTTVDVAVSGEVQSLRDVRDAINAGDAGVQAIIVADGGGFRLLLSSEQTGSASAMTLTVDGTLDGRLASAAMTETAAAVDAAYSINGLALTNSGNTLEDLIPGVSVTLNAVTDPGGVEIVVEPDREALATGLKDLVSAYNALVDVIAATGLANPGGTSGPLVGNAALRSLQSRVMGVFSATVAGDSDTGSLTSLLDVGFTTDASGKASLDTGRLDAALAEGDDAVAGLVTAFASGLAETLRGYTGTDGLLGAKTEGLNDQLKQVQQQRDALDARMGQVEARLRRQFAALDSLVAGFQATSGFLESQLASLAALQPGRNDG